MIFPILNGILSFRQIPVTYLLLLLNLIVAFLHLSLQVEIQASSDELFENDLFLRTGGQVYSQYLESRPESGSKITRDIASLARSGSVEQQKVLGT